MINNYAVFINQDTIATQLANAFQAMNQWLCKGIGFKIGAPDQNTSRQGAGRVNKTNNK